MADVDIDCKSSFNPLEIFPTAIPASRVDKKELRKHNSGVYFQGMARDPITNFSAIPYKEAEDMGYFKIDFLHLGLLDHFESKAEIRILLKTEPDWSMLQDPQVVGKLFQLHNKPDILRQVKPTTVIELADCIALIRPGKKNLLFAYLKDAKAIRPELYRKTDDNSYYYKKGHAVAYALCIVLQLHLIAGGIL